MLVLRAWCYKKAGLKVCFISVNYECLCCGSAILLVSYLCNCQHVHFHLYIFDGEIPKLCINKLQLTSNYSLFILLRKVLTNFRKLDFSTNFQKLVKKTNSDTKIGLFDQFSEKTNFDLRIGLKDKFFHRNWSFRPIFKNWSKSPIFEN